jgi:putative DNA primase/helicase
VSSGEFEFDDAPTAEELAKFDLNDYGNSRRFIRLIGGVIDPDGDVRTSRCTLLYQLGQGWVGYNGQFWDRKLGEQLAKRMGHKVANKMRGLYKDLAAAHPGVPAKELFKYLDGLGNRSTQSAMLALAEPYLTVEIDAFDRHPMALNCRNGTVWLTHDAAAPEGVRFRAVLKPHDPGDRLTRLIDLDYDPAAQAPLFRKTVETSISDEAMRAFFHRAQGYSATAAIHEQAIFLCQGLGRDGKSTILDAIRETLGSYGAVGAVATFLDTGLQGGGQAAPDIVKLAGDARMVVLSEPPRGAKWNEGLLKAWTSGSPITARELREKPFDFRPTGKLWVECNAFPVARGDDDGIWRRMFPILFPNQVAPDKVDRLLPKKLEPERPGILNWLIEGVAAWLEHGLAPPEGVTKVREDYRKQSSPFGEWLNERCVWGKAAEGERTMSSELFGDYKTWADEQGIDKPMSIRAFGDALQQRQILLAGKNRLGQKLRGPIRLKTQDERQAEIALASAGGPDVSDARAAVLDQALDAFERQPPWGNSDA